MIAHQLATRGWALLPRSDAMAQWVAQVAPHANALEADPDLKAAWLRHGGTWFAGVNVLGADALGAVAGGPPLPEPVRAAAQAASAQWDGFDAGQVSVCYPGYPQQDPGETEANARFRRVRDAAHVDGILRRGDPPRRFLAERHAFVLGIPVTPGSAEASPMVVWEGSPAIISAALQQVLRGVAPDDWDTVDVTDAYGAARKACFDRCTRMPVIAQPGEAYLVHRWALHGVAPWGAGDQKRSIIYFRPYATGGWDTFLAAK